MPELSDLIGVPFLPHGRSKEGYDCYGCAIEVSRRFGHELPDVWYDRADGATFDGKYSDVLSRLGGSLSRTGSFEEGNIILFSDRGRMVHIGVCLMGDDFIHCDRYGVRVSKLSTYQWRKYEVYKWSD